MTERHDLNLSNSRALTTDVVVVGGGIVGGALATVLARAGVDVTVLERDEQFRDRNKGEGMMPWGWLDAQQMGVSEVLDAAAGIPNPVFEIIDPDGSVRPVPVAQLIPDAPGMYSVAHPAACAALAEAAGSAGADVRFGATDVVVNRGAQPTVTWRQRGCEHRAHARVVIGADGRGSSVRRQLGLQLHRTARTHLISSVLVEGTRDLGDHATLMASDEKMVLLFPQKEGTARLYLVSRDQTFGGTEGAHALIEASRLPAAPDPERWASGRPAGPCATFGGEDTWVDRPVADGCVLVGDAAGYNSPIIGQGLSMAMRDARLVSEALLSNDRWNDDAFDAYATERAERLRRVRVIAQLWAKARLAPDEQVLRLREHPLLQPIVVGAVAGFDDADPDLFTDETARSLLADIGAGGPAPATARSA